MNQTSEAERPAGEGDAVLGKLRLAVFSMNYSPELVGTGKYSGQLGEWLSDRGAKVRVIAAPPYYPEWRVHDGYRSWRYKKDTEQNGTEVWRCPAWIPRKATGLKRVLCLLSFAISSLPVAIRVGFWRPDLVLVVEPPLLSAPGALLTAWIGGSKKWLHVQDFELDAAFDLGLIRSRLGKTVAARIERWLMGKFDRVSTISTRMCQRLSGKGVDRSKRFLFRNWIEAGQFAPACRDEAIRKELGIPQEKTLVLYSGNMGQKQGLETVIEAARSLEGAAIVFVMCGDGAARARLLELGSGLNNIKWLPLQPEEKFRMLLNLADIHLLPQRADVADLVMPSKLGAMLASGRPVIAMAREGTEVAEVVASRGIVIEPESAELLAGAIQDLAGDKQRRDELGRLGRQFAIENLDKSGILNSFLHEINGLVSGNMPQSEK